MKNFLMVAFTALVMVFCTACSNGADSVAKKIDNHEKLSQADYSLMINYVRDAFTELTGLSEKFASNPVKLQEEAKELEKKFPHIEQFTQTIISATDLDDDNKKKLEDLQSIIMKAMGIDPSMIIESAEASAKHEVSPADSIGS